MITAFYKLLNNSLRVDLLVRINTSKEGVNVSILAEEMERVVSLSVPLTAEAHWGNNWLEAKG